LIKKLIYLTITRSDITFAVGVLSRFMHQLRETQWSAALRILAWSAALRILAYIKSFSGKSLV